MNMKYSFMSFSCPNLEIKAMLETAKRFGYAGVEPRLDLKHRHGIELDCSPAERTEIRKLAETYEISICCLATGLKFAVPDGIAATLEQARKSIDLAHDLGSPRLRVFGGIYPDSISRQSAIDLMVESLASVAPYAERKQVVVCVEPHDVWCDPEHVGDVMRRANHPFIAVNWDIAHPVRSAGYTMEAAFNMLRPWIRHVHIHDLAVNDPTRKGLLPIGEGDIDHRTAVQLLNSIGYDGYVSGEWSDDWEPYEVHLPREIATMQSYEALV